MIIKLAIIFTLMLHSQALPQQEGDATNTVAEFRYIGNALACITDTANSELGYLPCLHIGDIYIKEELANVQKRFGEPWRIIEQDDTSEIRVYVLESKLETLPYVAITFVNNVTSSIQLTGYQTDDSLDFSGIYLGNSEKRVREVLGPPSSKDEVEEINGVRWSYSPFPISIEIKEENVYSIKIWEP